MFLPVLSLLPRIFGVTVSDTEFPFACFVFNQSCLNQKWEENRKYDHSNQTDTLVCYSNMKAVYTVMEGTMGRTMLFPWKIFS